MEDDFDIPSLSTGIILGGKYAIEKKIGDGGMGSVWEATHVEIGRKVAIKTLHRVERNRELALDRFRREAKMAGSIGHDNICEVTDIGKHADGSPYLVMPLLVGEPLGEAFANDRPMEVGRIANIARQTLSALHAAHEQGIIHRDLKPDNIFLTTFGEQGDVVKLLDFGICKLMDQDPVSSLTQSGTILGTPFYMAPEQAKGYKDLDPRVDVYAMGVIMYEALTGSPPFTGDSYNEIMFKIVEAQLPSLETVVPVPPAVAAVVMKAMSRDRDDRFDTAFQMRKALDKATGRVTGGSMEFHPAKSGDSAQSEGHDPSLHSAETIAVATEDIVRTEKKAPVALVATLVILALAAGVLLVLSPWSNDAVPQEAKRPKSAAVPPRDESPKNESQIDSREPPTEPTSPSIADAGIPDAGAKQTPAVEADEAPEPPRSNQPKKKKKKPPKNLKGRFGTKIVSDYDD